MFSVKVYIFLLTMVKDKFNVYSPYTQDILTSLLLHTKKNENGEFFTFEGNVQQYIEVAFPWNTRRSNSKSFIR
jgi:hypothetical protein